VKVTQHCGSAVLQKDSSSGL